MPKRRKSSRRRTSRPSKRKGITCGRERFGRTTRLVCRNSKGRFVKKRGR